MSCDSSYAEARAIAVTERLSALMAHLNPVSASAHSAFEHCSSADAGTRVGHADTSAAIMAVFDEAMRADRTAVPTDLELARACATAPVATVAVAIGQIVSAKQIAAAMSYMAGNQRAMAILTAALGIARLGSGTTAEFFSTD